MAASIQASETGLQRVDAARRKKGWNKKALPWCDAAGKISSSTLDRFWAKKPISQENFVAICQAVGIDDWEAIADFPLDSSSSGSPATPSPPTSHSLPYFFTYDSKTWTGRDRELTDLTAALEQGQRLLLIHGMTGIGKTALAERLAADCLVGTHAPLLRYVAVVLDREVRDVEFTRGAIAILEAMDDETAQQLPDDQILTYLLKQLRQTPIWLQLDSVEALLQPNGQGQPEFADPAWGEFLEQVVRDRHCQSRLILTTQAIPEDLATRLERLPQLWQAYPLEGLTTTHYLTLFRNCGVTPQTEAETDCLCTIASYFQGHPYILTMIAADVTGKLCGGNVSKYWQDYWLPRQQQNTAPLSQEQRARRWVNQTLAQLPDLPRQLLQHAAVFRRAVPEAFYLHLLPDQPASEMTAALALLKARVLVQETDIQAGQRLIQQHNLIRDVAYNNLQADPTRWHTAERQAAHLWLTAYEPPANAENLETVRGYLEAFDHYCEVGDWQSAKAVLMTKLNTPTRDEVYWQLGVWGYSREQIPLCEQILGKLDARSDGIWLNALGVAYSKLGDYQRSIDFHQQNLTIAQQIGDKQGEGNALGSLGSAYCSLGDYQRAIDFHQKHLVIAQQIGDKRGEGSALGNLGLDYHRLGDYQRAIDFHQQYLAITQQIGDKQGEGNALGNLGLAYYGRGDYQQAIDLYQQHLAIAQQIGDKQGESNTLGNLGNAYGRLGNHQRAINFLQQTLAIARAIGDKQGEGDALGNLGSAYDRLGDYQRAIDFHQQNLAIAQQIGDKQGEGNALGSLGRAYYSLGDYQGAIDFHQQNLAIAQQIGYKQGEGSALANLGDTQVKLEQYTEALQNLQLAHSIYENIGAQSTATRVLAMMGNADLKQGNLTAALSCFQTALEQAKKLEDYVLEGECYGVLGETYLKLDQYSEALNYLKKSLNIAQEIGTQANQAEVLKTLAELHQALGEMDMAQQYCQQALALATELGIPLQADCATLLESLQVP